MISWISSDHKPICVSLHCGVVTTHMRGGILQFKSTSLHFTKVTMTVHWRYWFVIDSFVKRPTTRIHYVKTFQRSR